MSDSYAEGALDRGRPHDPSECDECACGLHTYPDDERCIWCQGGKHRTEGEA